MSFLNTKVVCHYGVTVCLKNKGLTNTGWRWRLRLHWPCATRMGSIPVEGPRRGGEEEWYTLVWEKEGAWRDGGCSAADLSLSGRSVTCFWPMVTQHSHTPTLPAAASLRGPDMIISSVVSSLTLSLILACPESCSPIFHTACSWQLRLMVGTASRRCLFFPSGSISQDGHAFLI